MDSPVKISNTSLKRMRNILWGTQDSLCVAQQLYSAELGKKDCESIYGITPSIFGILAKFVISPSHTGNLSSLSSIAWIAVSLSKVLRSGRHQRENGSKDRRHSHQIRGRKESSHKLLNS